MPLSIFFLLKVNRFRVQLKLIFQSGRRPTKYCQIATYIEKTVHIEINIFIHLPITLFRKCVHHLHIFIFCTYHFLACNSRKSLLFEQLNFSSVQLWYLKFWREPGKRIRILQLRLNVTLLVIWEYSGNIHETKQFSYNMKQHFVSIFH